MRRGEQGIISAKIDYNRKRTTQCRFGPAFLPSDGRCPVDGPPSSDRQCVLWLGGMSDFNVRRSASDIDWIPPRRLSSRTGYKRPPRGAIDPRTLITNYSWCPASEFRAARVTLLACISGMDCRRTQRHQRSGCESVWRQFTASPRTLWSSSTCACR